MTTTDDIAALEAELHSVAERRDQLAAERSSIGSRFRAGVATLPKAERDALSRRDSAVCSELVQMIGRGAEVTKALTILRRSLRAAPP